MRNRTVIFIDVITSFIIGFVAAIGVALGLRHDLDRRAIGLASFMGLAVAAKSLRALYKLPPINGNYQTKNENNESNQPPH